MPGRGGGLAGVYLGGVGTETSSSSPILPESCFSWCWPCGNTVCEMAILKVPPSGSCCFFCSKIMSLNTELQLLSAWGT